MNVRYRVESSQADRDELTAMLSGGKHAARKLKRVQILLAADAGSYDAEIVRTVRVSPSTVGRTKRRFVGVRAVLIRKTSVRIGSGAIPLQIKRKVQRDHSASGKGLIELSH